MKPRIIMDERERGSIREAFQKMNCELDIQTLPIADYIVSKKIGIERKRGDDLVASLCDNRLFTQLTYLTEVFDKPLIILENSGRMFSGRNVYETSIYGAILYLMYKLRIAIIPARNEQETALVVSHLARISQKDSPLGEIVIPDPPKDLRSSQLYFLEGLYHVSEKSAIKLLDEFGSVNSVLNAIEDTSLVYTKGGNVKGITGLLTKIKGFGAKFVQKNQALLQTPYDDSEKMPW
jgi:DNA excision repair protein ERCC-4